MPYHLILGYILLSLSLSIMLYLQYSRNKENKTTSVLKKEIMLSLLGLIFSLAASINFIISFINMN